MLAPLATPDGLALLVATAVPLILCGLGIAMACRANVWNLGAEGQLAFGAAAAGLVADLAGPTAGAWTMPAMLLAAAAAGLAWAAIPAVLRTRWSAPEGLVSLLLSYAAVQLLGDQRDTAGARAEPQGEAGFVLAMATALLAWWLLARTLTGFRLRVVGLAPRAAAYAGFSTDAVVWLCLLGSGGLAGLAGAIAAGTILAPGIGQTALVAAFLGRLHPAGVVAASLLLADLSLGAARLGIGGGATLAETGVIPGLLLICLLACNRRTQTGRVANDR